MKRGGGVIIQDLALLLSRPGVGGTNALRGGG
jgi:hypothetical protein